MTSIRGLWAGVGGAYSSLCHFLGEKTFEWRFGKETSGYWYLDEHGFQAEESIWYDPAEWLGIRRAFRRLKPGPGDVIADVGSGKGRAVIVAALCPFGRVIGVELAQELTEIAQKAVARNRAKLACRDIKLVTSDALLYEFPADLNIVYLYSPFVGEVFRRFTDRLIAFADRVEHEVLLLYNYPCEHNHLIRTGRFEVVDVCSAKYPPRSLRCSEVIVRYRVLKSGAPARSDTAGTSASPGSPGTPGRPGKPLEPDAECWRGEYDPGFFVRRSPGKYAFKSGSATDV
jgi:hypothetical protein